jgi:hypothetical protein
MTRLSCHRFRSNEVRLCLSVIAYNLGNLWRRLALPRRVGNWSLTSSLQRLVKTGGRLVKHARYYWLLLAESRLTLNDRNDLVAAWTPDSKAVLFQSDRNAARRSSAAPKQFFPKARVGGRQLPPATFVAFTTAALRNWISVARETSWCFWPAQTLRDFTMMRMVC